MAQYRMKYNPVRNIFIVGTALAINNTWEEILEDYQIDFYRIRKREDVLTNSYSKAKTYLQRVLQVFPSMEAGNTLERIKKMEAEMR